MATGKTFQELFKRYRHPGDLFVAALTVAFALFLAACLPFQTTWLPRTQLFAQPAFWPAVAVGGMLVFSLLHLIGALVSERVEGRWEEVMEWLKAVEYVGWFLAYVTLVPVLGYLPATIAFTLSLTRRLGYRGFRWSLAALGVALTIVLIFKTGLRISIPAGALYDFLPGGAMRSLFMTYF